MKRASDSALDSVLGRLGDLCYRMRKVVLAIWIIVVIGLSFFAFQLPSLLKGSGFVMEGSFADANAILREDFGIYESTLLLVYERPDTMSDEQFEQAVGDSVAKLQALPLEALADTASPFARDNVRTDPTMVKDGIAYAALSFDMHTADMSDNLALVREAVQAQQDGPVPALLTGAPVIEADLNKASQDDLTRAEMIGLPVAMLVLLFAFGGLVAASLPLIIGLISVVSTLGVLYFFGLQMELSVFLLNVVVMLGLALGIDFALLFVNRFRQELQQHSVQESVRISVRTAGESIIFSGLCVFIGLAGMLFIQIDLFKVIALGGMTVVLFSILSALTLLPALLSLLGHRVNRLMLLKERPSKRSGWVRFASLVMRRPVLMMLTALVLLLACAIPIKDMVLRVPAADALPTNYASKIAYDLYDDTFRNSQVSEVIILAETEAPATEPESLQQLYALTERLTDDPLVNTVISPFSLAGGLDADTVSAMLADPAAGAQLAPLFEQLTSGDRMLLRVELNGEPYAQTTQTWVRDWAGDNQDVSLLLGGYAKFNQEIFDEISHKIVYTLGFILAATYLILFLAFRSVLIPLKAILMNALSLCATFGIIVWIFQNGHFGLTATDIALFIPIFIFSIVFGLSTDYEVFLISRIQEIYRETGDNNEATLQGLALTSKIITSAAAIMIVITGAFAFTGVMPVKQLGVGIALAILIDATIVRMILVPSMMKLLGRWNWWAPRFLRSRRDRARMS
ncbi:MMPL family transporter [Paenibacillus sp. 598K]|uniref:MMPL family transporter n=1 Tax=Paenibacillus sp. 598K TaxID=1117987 RepID=UPI000FFEB07E|nr:MMPL family transporter [Paenibacillus sp. 598K]